MLPEKGREVCSELKKRSGGWEWCQRSFLSHLPAGNSDRNGVLRAFLPKELSSQVFQCNHYKAESSRANLSGSSQLHLSQHLSAEVPYELVSASEKSLLVSLCRGEILPPTVRCEVSAMSPTTIKKWCMGKGIHISSNKRLYSAWEVLT